MHIVTCIGSSEPAIRTAGAHRGQASETCDEFPLKDVTTLLVIFRIDIPSQMTVQIHPQ